MGSVGAPTAGGQVASRNACPHNRRAPELFPSRRGGAGRLGKEAIELLLANYPRRGTNGDRLPSLLKRAHGRRSKRSGATIRRYTVTQKRSQRSEAETRILIFALEHMDEGAPPDPEGDGGIPVGRWSGEQKKIVRPFTLAELAEATGLHRPSQRYEGKLRSSSRFDRALRVLADDCAEYVHRHQGRELEGEQWSGKIAKLNLTFNFFVELGIPAERVKVLRREAREWRAKQDEKEARKAPVAPVRALLSQVLEPAIHDLRPSLPPGLAEADVPAYHWACDELRDAHADWSADQIRDEAVRRVYQRKHRPPDSR